MSALAASRANTQPQCSCGATAPRAVLARADSAAAPVATSDGAYLADVRAARLLCRDCGVLEAVYDPPDALSRHFARDYDLAPAVQNNLVVRDGVVHTKKSLIDHRLDAWIARRAGGVRAALEVACGRGDLARRLAAAYPHWEVTGLDPSPDLEPQDAGPGSPRLLRSVFRPERFAPGRHDLLIAHGLLNRTPPLAALQGLRRLARPGALASFELVYLETAPYAPRIWDHAFHATRATVHHWLAVIGFHVLEEADNASSWHVIAEACDPKPGPWRPSGETDHAGAHFEAFVRWWTAAETAARREAARGPYALFGAGMFSAALSPALSATPPAAVIDDVKAGGRFHGLDVITREEAAARGLAVVLFTRPAYVDAMAARARAAGLTLSDVTPPLPGPSSGAFGE